MIFALGCCRLAFALRSLVVIVETNRPGTMPSDVLERNERSLLVCRNPKRSANKLIVVLSVDVWRD